MVGGQDMERGREECVACFCVGVFRGDMWGVGVVRIFFLFRSFIEES